MKFKIWPVMPNFFMTITLLMFCLPVSLNPNITGLYNSVTKISWCTIKASCFHEDAHKMDQKLGWPSHSRAWQDALRLYIITETQDGKISELANVILVHKLDHVSVWDRLTGDPDTELYSLLYEYCWGTEECMPEVLRPFYSWD